jgi:uncharacterized protein (DUF1778 family)
MSMLIRMTDAKGRVCLPGFVKTAVVLEAVNDDEYRVRRATTAQAGTTFDEEAMPTRLSKRDAKRLVQTLKKPPLPNAAARRAARRFKKAHG